MNSNSLGSKEMNLAREALMGENEASYDVCGRVISSREIVSNLHITTRHKSTIAENVSEKGGGKKIRQRLTYALVFKSSVSRAADVAVEILSRELDDFQVIYLRSSANYLHIVEMKPLRGECHAQASA